MKGHTLAQHIPPARTGCMQQLCGIARMRDVRGPTLTHGPNPHDARVRMGLSHTSVYCAAVQHENYTPCTGRTWTNVRMLASRAGEPPKVRGRPQPKRKLFSQTPCPKGSAVLSRSGARVAQLLRRNGAHLAVRRLRRIGAASCCCGSFGGLGASAGLLSPQPVTRSRSAGRRLARSLGHRRHRGCLWSPRARPARLQL